MEDKQKVTWEQVEFYVRKLFVELYERKRKGYPKI